MHGDDVVVWQIDQSEGRVMRSGTPGVPPQVLEGSNLAQNPSIGFNSNLCVFNMPDSSVFDGLSAVVERETS